MDNTRPRTDDRSLGAPFWKLWTSSGLSNLADGVLKTAMPLVALHFTDSPVLIAGVTLALSLPWLLFSLPAGALADRLDRRHAMLGANTVRAGLLAALGLALALDLGSLWLLYAVAFGIGLTETLYDTTTQSILPQLVPRSRLPRANGRLIAAELTANQFLGPPLGGILVATGLTISFLAPAALWAVAVGVLLMVRGDHRAARPGVRTTLRADIAEGLRFLWGNRVLRWMAVMVGTANFASNMTFSILVLFAVGPASPMGLGAPAFGALMTTVAAGGLLGSLAAERVEARLGRARTLVLSIPVCAVLVGVPALTTHPLLVGSGFFLGGVAIAIWNVITVSLRQRVTPDHLLGRVNSGYRLVGWGTIPLGAVTGGVIAQLFGLTTAFAVAALLTLSLVGVVLTRLTDARMDRAEREAQSARSSIRPQEPEA